MKKMKFEWDIKKDEQNKQKHKVTFPEACLVFADNYSLNLFDNAHSIEDPRWITMGQIPGGEILVVVHTFRELPGKEIIRIISARKASKKEKKQYFARRL